MLSSVLWLVFAVAMIALLLYMSGLTQVISAAWEHRQQQQLKGPDQHRIREACPYCGRVIAGPTPVVRGDVVVQVPMFNCSECGKCIVVQNERFLRLSGPVPTPNRP